MRKLRFLVPAVAVALAAAAVAAAMSAPKLTGTVGPGFTISLKKGTSKVKTLKPGKYTFAVTDKASIHNFRLTGPGVAKSITTVGFRGTAAFTATLKKGTYRFFCVPHSSTMKGSFKVT